VDAPVTSVLEASDRLPLLEIRRPEQLTHLRVLLREADFTVPTVCHRLGIESVYDFRSIREGRTVGLDLQDSLDLLIRLFMDVELLDRDVVQRLLPPGGLALLESFGLLRAYAGDAGQCHAAVLLYPTESLWVVSDLNVSPAGPAEMPLSEDAVYPAITKNTRHFLSSLPSTPCERFLELCAGTGIAALLASRYALRTWAADITERATRFARFNAALNGIVNCTPVQGDLYQPLQGECFDRIVAHPPYMPSLEQKYIFRDGGEDGEQITRRIIAGLPEHLSPGGRFYCTCMLSDRKGARAETRIREMLGIDQRDFDVALVTLQTYQPTEYYLRLAMEGRATLEELAPRQEIFKRLEVEHLVYCSMVVQRRSESREVFTARRQVGAGVGLPETEWLLQWEAAAAQPATVQGLIEARPIASSRARLRLAHALQSGTWVADECTLATASPFAVEARCPPWTGTLVGRCDGRKTTRDHLQFLKESGAVPADAPESEFVKLVRALIAGGFLELADFPLPQVAPQPPSLAPK
jgi:methylase of polypeptide subunit release factors